MSTEPLHRLLYVSRNTITGNTTDVHAEIAQILATSAHNNAPAGVTGALMFNAGCFAQVLEGPGEAIEATFERIQTDDRHNRVHLISYEPTPMRGFPSWSMAYVGADTHAMADFAAIATEGFDAALLTGDRIYDLLRAHLHEAEAQLA